MAYSRLRVFVSVAPLLPNLFRNAKKFAMQIPKYDTMTKQVYSKYPHSSKSREEATSKWCALANLRCCRAVSPQTCACTDSRLSTTAR